MCKIFTIHIVQTHNQLLYITYQIHNKSFITQLYLQREKHMQSLRINKIFKKSFQRNLNIQFFFNKNALQKYIEYRLDDIFYFMNTLKNENKT